MIPRFAVKSLGRGCKATGAPVGWNLSGNRLFQCPECLDYLQPSEMTDSGGCLCGNVFLDYDYNRFGARTGDSSIEVFEIIDTDGVILNEHKRMYDFIRKSGQYYLSVVCGGIAMYEREVLLTEDESRLIFAEGKRRLDAIAHSIAQGNSRGEQAASSNR